ncbi:MAG: acyl-CoA thioesterase [Deltaproteobacteria bacterium]|nr:acyl-CoA thioesterase [Deltaproteobacteria bacterium]
MEDALITYRGTVYPWHCDHMGHMNVMWYVGKFDEATWNLFACLGLTPSYLRDSDRGMVAVEQHVSYKREVVAGDVVFIRSWVLEVREKVLRFSHEMINSESQEVAAVTELTGVHIDRSARKSSPFPESVLDRARVLAQRPATSRS